MKTGKEDFFFEKKKQKTFVYFGLFGLGGTGTWHGRFKEAVGRIAVAPGRQ